MIKAEKKSNWLKYIGMVFMILTGAVCGWIIGTHLDSIKLRESDRSGLLLIFASIVVMYLSLFLQIIIHEAGHLVFGLLSGYRFSSFRIASFMWVSEGGKIKFKRLTIAGTGGQCLMAPPGMDNGKIPIVWYNLGGTFFNLFAALIGWGMYHLFADAPVLSPAMLIFSITGIGIAAMNGIPLKMGVINNDGYNAFALRNNPKALKAFWLQMKVGEELVKGKRLKDMPEEWFFVPTDEEMENSMVAAIGVFNCNRLLDTHNFEEAANLMTHILEIDSGMVGLHRNLLICDQIYLELIGRNDKNVLNKLYTKEQQKFMGLMKGFPSVIRTNYTYALFGEKDSIKAETVKSQFEKYAKTHPYRGDIESEKELMEIAEERLAYSYVEGEEE